MSPGKCKDFLNVGVKTQSFPTESRRNEQKKSTDSSASNLLQEGFFFGFCWDSKKHAGLTTKCGTIGPIGPGCPGCPGPVT